MSKQTSLDLSSKSTASVECLGQSFPSDEARREHYLKLLAEKLKDPEFRKIEGFPIGEDEDILALSDPPYYTACPNPWIGDFIKHYDRPYDPKEKYHREPFAADVSEGKNHPIYNAHSYHTKVPHRAIMRYILHYTEPGDVVFDGFCGTGMTGVAAELCGNEKEVREMGYRVDADGMIYNQEGKVFSKLGARRAVLNDLSPAASFIAYNYNTPVEVDVFENETKRILDEVEKECGWMYHTSHTDGRVGTINHVIWSDVLSCKECGSEIILWNEALDPVNGSVRDIFPCPNCSLELTKRSMNRVWITVYDDLLKQTMKFGKQVPVVIDYAIGNKRFNKEPDRRDLELIDKITKVNLPLWIPVHELPGGSNTGQPLSSHGFSHAHHFYTRRNLITIGKFAEAIPKISYLGLLTGVTSDVSKMARVKIGYYFKGGGGPFIPGLSGTLYVPSFSVEKRVTFALRNRVKAFARSDNGRDYRKGSKSLIFTSSMGDLATMSNDTLDYLFLDPPFGANINYSELNSIWETWLKVETNIKQEAIENDFQKKTLNDYRALMTACFMEANRILKPGRWMTIEFSNTNASVWNSIQSALTEAGFVVANVSALDKKQGSFKAVTTTTAVKQDLVISAYKPNGGLEERFRKSGHTVEGVWDFMRTHLLNLPVVKPKGGELEYITERDPRILYDRMVAFYVGHGVPVPLSSAEFQAALAEKFPEREGMFFLPEQVTEWDKQRAKMKGVGQMSIFVEDERSAIDWLRNYLKSRPSSYQDIQPEFMQQLGASWKKFETRPELSLLLEQNFLKYDDKGEVPSQIHSYLSTQFKDLRNLTKDDPRLQAKAKDRWYVPDPGKAVDVEAVRNKRLLAEFWDLCAQAGINRPASEQSDQGRLPFPAAAPAKKGARKKLKEVRTEAVRLGFKECFAAKNYATILALSEHLPENVIEEDEQLQMIHDMAEMRAGN